MSAISTDNDVGAVEIIRAHLAPERAASREITLVVTAENARLTTENERLTRIETAAQRVCDNPIWADYGVGVIEEMDDLRAELARKEAARG